MAGSLNKVLLIGRLGADPEIKQMVNGKSVARLSLATSQSWKDKNTGEKKEKTEWHRIVVFNEGLVNVIQQYLKKVLKSMLKVNLQLENGKMSNLAKINIQLKLFFKVTTLL
jgi:single stranded DNA-binding protein